MSLLWQQRQRHLGSARQDVSSVLHCCRVDVFEASTEVSFNVCPECNEILLVPCLIFRFVAFYGTKLGQGRQKNAFGGVPGLGIRWPGNWDSWWKAQR